MSVLLDHLKKLSFIFLHLIAVLLAPPHRGRRSHIFSFQNFRTSKTFFSPNSIDRSTKLVSHCSTCFSMSFYLFIFERKNFLHLTNAHRKSNFRRERSNCPRESLVRSRATCPWTVPLDPSLTRTSPPVRRDM